jgi:hypothetical protein
MSCMKQTEVKVKHSQALIMLIFYLLCNDKNVVITKPAIAWYLEKSSYMPSYKLL